MRLHFGYDGARRDYLLFGSARYSLRRLERAMGVFALFGALPGRDNPEFMNYRLLEQCL